MNSNSEITKYSLVIPCFNEEQGIPELAMSLERLEEAMPGLEIIFVNNGSSDLTGDKLEKHIKVFKRARVVHLESNEGYGRGIKSGIEVAKGDFVGWMHADLQVSPEVFQAFAKEADKSRGPILVKGKRRGRTVVENAYTTGMSIFESILFLKWMTDINAQPTLVSKQLSLELAKGPNDFSLDLFTYLRAKTLKFSVKRVEVSFSKRKWGHSSWNVSLFSPLRFIVRTLRFSFRLRFGGFDRDYN